MFTQQFSKEILALVEVQEKNLDQLMMKPNVVGVGLGPKVSNGRETGTFGITVYVSSKLDISLLNKSEIVPKQFGEVKTDVVETGVLFAQSDRTLKDKVRPSKGGYSIGHYQVTAGTIGTCVVDATPFPGIPNTYYILSNNHVLANSNSAHLGDPILQPGPADGGVMPHDVIARLSRFVPIDFSGGCNYVDAALGQGNLDDLDREVYWTGYVKGVRPPTWGMTLYKTGRTTGHSSGQVIGINATVMVHYGGGKVAKFCKQILTTAMSQGGDSGSLMVDQDGYAVGLLFAGSTTVTIANDIQYVLQALQVKFR